MVVVVVVMVAGAGGIRSRSLVRVAEPATWRARLDQRERKRQQPRAVTKIE